MWFRRLDRCLRALAAGEPIPEPEQQWLLAGIARFVETDEPLEHALGLYPYTRSRYLRAKRDESLRAAYDLIGDINLFARKVKLFGHSKWKAWDSAPDTASALDRALFRAFSCGLDVPASRRQLERICGVDSGVDATQPDR